MTLVRTGSWVAVRGTAADREPALAGSVLADELVQIQFTRAGRPAIVLECQDRVVQSTQDGRRHFYFRVRRVLTNTTGSPVRLSMVMRQPGQLYDQTQVDMDWRQDGLGTLAPAEAGYLQPDASFRFAPDAPPLPADGTRFMYIRTAALRHSREGRLSVALAAGSGVDVAQAGVTCFRPA